MDIKNYFVAVLVLLLASSAFAAVTITWNTPATGTVYNNLPANIRTIDLNFTIADNNSETVNDFNLNLIYYADEVLRESGTVIVQDANLQDWNANPGTNYKCAGFDATSFTCSYVWTLPSSTVMTEGTWRIDANVMDYNHYLLLDYVNADVNSDITLTIYNKIGSGPLVRSLIPIMALVLIAAAVLGGITAVLGFKADPATTTMFVIAAAVAVGICAMAAMAVLVTL